jgi:hypothetical protein
MTLDEFTRVLEAKIARTGDDDTLLGVHMTRAEWRALVMAIKRLEAKAGMFLSMDELLTELGIDNLGDDD